MRKIIVALVIMVICHTGLTSVQAEEYAWQDEIIYFIMIDRFANGDPSNDFEVDLDDPAAYHGGDFQGIIDKLDYIKEMGFTAIWLTPIVNNEPRGYHGYWTEDFYEVEEHFGTLNEFKTLVREAHERDMKIIVDLVVNHTGYQHPWLNDSEKQDWFHKDKPILDWNNQENIENGRLAGLPDLAQENPEVRRYLLDMAKWWIEETDIDGYRLDTVKHVPKDFWEEFVREVKSVKANFFLIGEVWHNDPTYVADYAETGIDSFVDYPFYNEAGRIFSRPDQRIGKYMNGIWDRNKTLYDHPFLLGNFIDNHDNKRFVRIAVEQNQDPVTRLKLALTYMYTAPGIPIVYYGTEIAMDGGDDPDNRRMMDFSNHELVSYISTLGELRQEHLALTEGELELLIDQVGTTVFLRKSENDSVLVAINNTTKDQEVTITKDMLAENTQLNPVFGNEIPSKGKDGFVITLPKESSEIFLLEANKDNESLIVTYWYFVVIGIIALAVVGFLLFQKKRRFS